MYRGRFRTGDALNTIYLLLGADLKYIKEKFLISTFNYFGKRKEQYENLDEGAFKQFMNVVGECVADDKEALSKPKIEQT